MLPTVQPPSTTYSSHEFTYSQNGNKRKRLFWLIISLAVIIAAIIIGLIVWLFLQEGKKTVSLNNQNSNPTQSQKAPIAVNDGRIVIADRDKLYLFDTSLMKKTELDIPELQQTATEEASFQSDLGNLSFTHDGQFLFFSKDDTLYIYNFEIQQTETLPFSPNAAVLPQEISPNNVIAVVDTGTAPGLRDKVFVDFKAGKTLYEATGQNVEWALDSQHFALETEGVEWWNLELGPQPSTHSITLGTVGNTVTGKAVLRGANKLSFELVEWIDDSTFLYKQHEYSKAIPPRARTIPNDASYQEEWMNIYENPTTTLWTYEISKGTKQEASQSAAIKPQLENQNMSPNGKWSVEREGDAPPFGIYIVSLDGKQKIKISSGTDAIWQP